VVEVNWLHGQHDESDYSQSRRFVHQSTSHRCPDAPDPMRRKPPPLICKPSEIRQALQSGRAGPLQRSVPRHVDALETAASDHLRIQGRGTPRKLARGVDPLCARNHAAYVFFGAGGLATCFLGPC
jgi:hypothetical protein